MTSKVSIIILNWNGLDDTVGCLQSLKEITYKNYNIIVVDNGSKGNDAEILKSKFGEYIHIIENDRNYGFAGGCNIGIRYAMRNFEPDYILLLNNDTTVAPDFLSEMVNVAESDPSFGIAGAKIYFYHEPNKIQAIGGQINWRTGMTSMLGINEMDVGQFNEIRAVDWVVGCALLIKREVLQTIGLLYERYFAYFEEVEWCVRCSRAGYLVIHAPGARVWHKKRFSIDEISGLNMYYMTRNRFLFMVRNATVRQLSFFFVYFLFRHLPTFTAQSLYRYRSLKLLTNFYRGVFAGIRATAIMKWRKQ
ncbi:MAG: glycosyltransferase family 2 protein [Chloroflexi bacterium]|nr:glycosyltransferase family 2 protein [Chloroflexota bacterium]